jgi:hypothetical protein
VDQRGLSYLELPTEKSTGKDQARGQCDTVKDLEAGPEEQCH